MTEISIAAETKPGRKWFWLSLLAFILLLVVFFKNAWVCDDAYINFRAIEQLFAGNGPNWNPHQRVQVYTSPAWFWLLAGFRVLSNDHFFNAVILSFVCLLLLAFNLFRHLSLPQTALAFFLLAASNAFADFSTSGLENILCGLLLALALLEMRRCQDSSTPCPSRAWALLWLSLLPLCRHDLITFMVPLTAIFIVHQYQGKWPRLRALLLSLLPLLAWSAFSLLYYGALFPNTAYAKISTGIPRLELMVQGLRYFLVTLQQDPLTILLIFAALFVGFRSDNRLEKGAAIGIVLNLIYVIWVGGDFMRGRFFSGAYLLAVILLVSQFSSCSSILCRKNLCTGLVLIFIAYLLVFPSTPLNTGFNYANFNLDHGIADERGYYFDVCSLYAYLYSNSGEVFPDFEWSHIGRQIAEKKVAYLENDFNGMLGYWAGTAPIIVDRLALADPFLARIPVKGEWRIGHFKREVPGEYRASIQSGKNLFPEGRQRDLFALLHEAVAAENLLSMSRFVAILRLNLRLY